MKNKNKPEQITIRLTDEQFAKLESWRKALQRSRADFIGEILDALPEPKERKIDIGILETIVNQTKE